MTCVFNQLFHSYFIVFFFITMYSLLCAMSFNIIISSLSASTRSHLFRICVEKKRSTNRHFVANMNVKLESYDSLLDYIADYNLK